MVWVRCRSNLPRLPNEKSDSPPCTAYDPHIVSSPGGATAEFKYVTHHCDHIAFTCIPVYRIGVHGIGI